MLRGTTAAISAFLLILALAGIAVEKNTSGSPSVVSSAPSFSSATEIPVPSARTLFDMAYDLESDRVVLFGGRTSAFNELGDTWAYDFDANSWTKMSPVDEPPPRFGHAMVYVGVDDRILLFGGYFGGVYSDETWVYDYDSDTWTELSPATSPSPRAGHEMAYDAGSNQVVMFGGNVAGVLNGETWVYDLTAGTWTQMSPTISPSPRERHRMVYVPSGDRVVLFGGSLPAFADDTWAYDFETDTWERKSPTTRPSARHGHDMAYDSGSNTVILFSGDDDPGNNETWMYDLATDAWVAANPPSAPARRLGHRLEYDSSSARTILFGGSNNETWAYDSASNMWSPLTPPSAPTGLDASPGNGVVDLTWFPPPFNYGSPVTNYNIYRGTVSGDLPLLAEVDTVQTYVDANVTVGVTYFYQVSAVTLAGEGPRSSEDNATPFDATDPSIEIISPEDEATLAFLSVEVTGNASDNVALERVELSTDETGWVRATITDSSWSRTLTLEEGANTIYARATDTSGNMATVNVSVTVDTTPSGVSPETIIVAGVVAGGTAAAIGALLWLRSRRMRKGEG